jgi:hypothetical protein
MRRSRHLFLGSLALAAAASLTACAYQGASSRVGAPHRVVVGPNDDGGLVTVHVGDDVSVVLTSTYWTIADSPNVNVLANDGAQAVHPRLAGCVPGEGCGTAVRDYVATATGTVTLTAHRVSCGEALRCVGDRGDFSVVVDVD